MIWIAAAVSALAVFIGWRVDRQKKSRYVDTADTVMLILLGVVGSILPVIILGGLIPATLFEGYDKHVETKQIVAFADNTHTEGEFFLLSGSLDSNSVYSFYEERDDKGIRQGHVDTERSLIYEDQKNTGYVEVYRTGCFDWTFWTLAACNGTRYEIHIPEDTVTRQFNLDLEN